MLLSGREEDSTSWRAQSEIDETHARRQRHVTAKYARGPHEGPLTSQNSTGDHGQMKRMSFCLSFIDI